MRAGHRLPLVLLAAAAAAGCVTAAQASVPRAAFTSLCGAMDGTHPATIGHVMVIVFENKSYGAVVGSSSAPYLNGTLIPGCGLATNYHNYSHPSTPNYLALTSGTAQGKAASADCTPAGCPQAQASIFAQLGAARRSWREYAEAMPANCAKRNYDNTTYPNADGSTGEFYYVRHAPPPYYTSVPVPGECRKQDVPLGTSTAGNLLDALSPASDGLPAFSFVTPGGCDDMHDCPIGTGDDWLHEWIPVIGQSAPTRAAISRCSSPGTRAPARTRPTVRPAGTPRTRIRWPTRPVTSPRSSCPPTRPRARRRPATSAT